MHGPIVFAFGYRFQGFHAIPKIAMAALGEQKIQLKRKELP
jgi:hypothetical protein